MIYSNERKLCLSGWLKENNNVLYETPLKLQKFLLFYEAFAKVSGENPDFSHLKGYKNGPVFSNVWRDYIKERSNFNSAAQDVFTNNSVKIDTVRAEKCAFIVSTMTEKELSDLTHQMNLWKCKEERIMNGECQVDLSESDFNSDDEKLIRALDTMYPSQLVENSTIVCLDRNYFVFTKSDAQHLTEEHFDTLLTLAENEELYNPVFVDIVDIDGRGELIVDDYEFHIF